MSSAFFWVAVGFGEFRRVSAFFGFLVFWFGIFCFFGVGGGRGVTGGRRGAFYEHSHC